jgi:pimeloyl-ACP methyl ester carboxylesterase
VVRLDPAPFEFLELVSLVDGEWLDACLVERAEVEAEIGELRAKSGAESEDAMARIARVNVRALGKFRGRKRNIGGSTFFHLNDCRQHQHEIRGDLRDPKADVDPEETRDALELSVIFVLLRLRAGGLGGRSHPMRVKVGDVQLFFDVEGAKLRSDGAEMREVPTVLLLHGGPGFDHSNFMPDFSRLTEIAQVVYLDHRGNGRSDRGDPSRWNLPQWGDDVRAFCEALEIERPVVLGLSFGGMVAMSYATRHPEHPAKLVLSSTAAQMRPDRSLDAFERLGGPEVREAARRFFENPGPETVADFQRKCFPVYNINPMGPEFTLRSVTNFDLTFEFFRNESRRFNFLPELGRIRCPTLIAAGELDPITPVADARDIAAALPPRLGRLELFHHAGHGAHRDQPERFFKVLKEFILK